MPTGYGPVPPKVHWSVKTSTVPFSVLTPVVSCTDYCVCEAGDNCLNPLTIRDTEEEDLEEEGDEEDDEEGE